MLKRRATSHHLGAKPQPRIVKPRAQQSVCPSGVVPASGGLRNFRPRSQATENEQQVVVRLRSDVATAQPATGGRATFGRRTQAASIGRQMNCKLRRSRAAGFPPSPVGRRSTGRQVHPKLGATDKSAVNLQHLMSLHSNPATGGRLVPATGASDPDPAAVGRLVSGQSALLPQPDPHVMFVLRHEDEPLVHS